MSQLLAPGFQDRRATLLGWALFICFFALFININILPRTPIDQRGLLRIVHDSLGLIVIIIAILRLHWFIKGPRLVPPPGLPDNSFAINRAIMFALILTFVVTGLLGFFYAWGEHDREIILFGIPVPALLPDGEGLRTSMGYTHSALSFYYLMLFTVWFIVGFYQNFRYKVGLRRLLPGAMV
jgi:cytochrome b561